MTYNLSICVKFDGEKFSPRAFSKTENIQFCKSHETGDVSKFTKRKFLFGSACKNFEDETFAISSNALGFVKQYHDSLKGHGVEEIVFYALVEWRNQCNMELDPDFLSALGSLGICLAITCDEVDTE